MSRAGLMTRWLAASAVLLTLQPQRTWACAACFGKSDSALAQGMNMGIFSLLAVILTVLTGVAGFFIYLARKSARTPEVGAPVEMAEVTKHV